MRIVRLSSPFGAEIPDTDPNTFGESERQELRAALWEHKLLVFHGVDLSPQQQVDLMAAIGRVAVEPNDKASLDSAKRLDGKVSYVTTRPSEYLSTLNQFPFHADFQFFSDGAAQAISLHAIEAESGNPTIFADMVAAVQRMPASLLERLRGLDVVQCFNPGHSQKEYGTRYRISHRGPDAPNGNHASVQPAIGRHPVTGEELVNVSETFSSHFKGMTEDESNTLFAEVARYQYDPEFLCHHDWTKGDLIIWDNIALQHGRNAVRQESMRHLQRVLVNRWDWTELEQRTGVAMAGVSLV